MILKMHHCHTCAIVRCIPLAACNIALAESHAGRCTPLSLQPHIELHSAGSSIAAVPNPDDEKLHSGVWSQLASMSRSLPSSLLQAHLRQGIAKHGSDWLLARWLEIQASPEAPTTGYTPSGSQQSRSCEPESHAGRLGKQKLSKAQKQRPKKPASHRGTEVPGNAAVVSGTGSSVKGATFTTSSMADEHQKAAIAEVIEWLGAG